MDWFRYPIIVPFGNINFDSGLGGSHDLTVGAPANTPVTALLSGVIVDVSAPSWGKQVGIKLDVPYNGIQFLAFLHLSATNVQIGDRVNRDSIIGWVGGANTPSQYNGTSNPTGSNFLNDTFMSSQVQVGVALIRGPVYGTGAGWGWSKGQAIDTSLDPTSLIDDARNGVLTMPDYPGALDFTITDPAWIFPNALLSVPTSDLTIVIHKTGCGAFCSATDVANGFRNDTVSHKSAHFVVGRDGSVLQVVLLKDGAGANCCLEAGHDTYWDRLQTKYGNLNRCTISIEHEDWTSDNSQVMPQAQIDTSFKLVQWLCARYHLLPSQIKGHNTLDPLSRARCPGSTYPMSALLSSLSQPVTPPPVVVDRDKAFAMEWTIQQKTADPNSGIALAAKKRYWTPDFTGPATSLEGQILGKDGKVYIGQTDSEGIWLWNGSSATHHPYSKTS